jgi:redox-sensitive bicupin YhaK (pirin superfamily)
MMKVTKSSQHYYHDEGWLSTYWHFSFADYYDPKKTNFGPLRVFNDDMIKPGTGFGFHPHRDMEIVTYVIEGSLEHRDDQGNHGVIGPGEVQRMTAGRGIVHSEYNHSDKDPLRLLQIWVFANKRGLEPSWEQRRFEKQSRRNRLLPVVVPQGTLGAEAEGEREGEEGKQDSAVKIHQDVTFYIASLAPDKRLDLSLKQGRKAYLFVIDGKVRLDNEELETRDAARIERQPTLSMKAARPSEIMLLDLPEKYEMNS